MSNKKYSISKHEAAPEIILDMIAELNAILEKSRPKAKEEALLFYDKLLNNLRFAYSFMMDTHYIHQENAMLKEYNHYLVLANQSLRDRLNEFDTVLKLKADDRLQEIVSYCQIYSAKSQKTNS